MRAIKAKPILGNKTLTLKPLLNKYGKLTMAEMEKTTETWNNIDPTFEYEIEETLLTVGPTDDHDGDIWRYLEEGTDIRYAVMSEDFEPKTTVRVVGSTTGVGGLTHFDFENPKPGIEAREWTEVIGEKLEPEFAKDIQNLIKRTLRVM